MEGRVSQTFYLGLRFLFYEKNQTCIKPLICIRNAVIDSTLKIKTGEACTRANDGQTISLPIPRTKYIRKTPFYWGSQIWNTLPLAVRTNQSKIEFKRYITQALSNNTIRLNFEP